MRLYNLLYTELAVVLSILVGISVEQAFANDIDYQCDDGSTARSTALEELIVKYPSNVMILLPLSADLNGRKLYGNMKTISRGCTPDSADPVCGATYFDEISQTPRALFILKHTIIQCASRPYFIEEAN